MTCAWVRIDGAVTSDFAESVVEVEGLISLTLLLIMCQSRFP